MAGHSPRGFFKKLKKIIKQEKPDIVHTHASSIARLAARMVKGTRVIYTRHCAYPVSERIKKVTVFFEIFAICFYIMYVT